MTPKSDERHITVPIFRHTNPLPGISSAISSLSRPGKYCADQFGYCLNEIVAEIQFCPSSVNGVANGADLDVIICIDELGNIRELPSIFLPLVL